MPRSIIRHAAFAALALLTWVGFQLSEARAATLIRTQPPCVTSGPCFDFTDASALPTVRSITFVAPGSGRVQVFFTGSLFCGASNGAAVSLESQIVNIANATPSSDGPGGQRYSISFEGTGRSDTFSLSATRTFVVSSAGSRTYYFKLNRVNMNEGARCWVYDAAFSLVFVN